MGHIGVMNEFQEFAAGEDSGWVGRTSELLSVESVITSSGTPPGATWFSFEAPRVNAHGSVAFRATVVTVLGHRPVVVQDGLQTLGGYQSGAKQIDDRGFVLYEGQFGGVNNATLVYRYLGPSGPNVDVDGDGLPDPGYSFGPTFGGPGVVAMAGAGDIYAWGVLEDPTGNAVVAVVQRDLTPGDEVICAGEVNSTGYPARLSAFGTSVVSFQETELLAIGLPPDHIALPLFSLTPNPLGPQPPGSQGTLCLGGAIGRGLSMLMRSNFQGQGLEDIHLNAVPQPSGPVVAQAGETWYCQLWYRDTHLGAPTSNFSDAIGILFR